MTYSLGLVAINSHYLSYSWVHIITEAKFSYDLSPIAVSYLEESRNWYNYLTSLMAIIGGTFVVFGMLDSSLFSLSKKKSHCYY